MPIVVDTGDQGGGGEGRHWFGGTYHDWVARPQRFGPYNFARFASDTPITFWTAPVGGTQHTDLMVNGAPASQVVTDHEGFYQEFQGPPGVQVMWGYAGHPDGTRYLLVTTDVAIELSSELSTRIPISDKGAPFGVATLDGLGVLQQPYYAENMQGVLDPSHIPPGLPYAAKDQPFINLREFPRIGTEQNDKPRFDRWLDAVIAANGIGWIPPGDYYFTTAVQKTIPDGTRFQILGAGPDVTRLHANVGNNQGCLIFETNRNGEGLLDSIGDRVAVFQGFSLYRDGSSGVPTDGTGVGLAFRAGIPPFTHNGQGSNRHNYTLFARDLWAGGSNGRYYAWDTAYDFRGHFHPTLIDVVATGIFLNLPTIGSPPAVHWPNSSPSFYGQYGLILDGSYGWNLFNCSFQNFHTGISDIGTSAEGGRAFSLRVVGCRIGINRVRSGDGGFDPDNPEDPLVFTGAREPVLAILDSHFSCRDSAIKVDGTRYLQVSRCVIYNVDTEGYSTAPDDIFVTNFQRITIENNIFAFEQGHPDRVHVRLSHNGGDWPASSVASGSYVKNNIFVARGQSCIVQSAGCEKAFWTWNHVEPLGVDGYDDIYVDNANTATIVHTGDMSVNNSTALMVSLNRAGVVSEPQRFLLGPVGSGPGGSGRAVYTTD